MVHIPSRSANGVKLPSVGKCLNASKAETRLDMATSLLGWRFVRGTIGFVLQPVVRFRTCAVSALVYPDATFYRVLVPNRL